MLRTASIEKASGIIAPFPVIFLLIKIFLVVNSPFSCVCFQFRSPVYFNYENLFILFPGSFKNVSNFL